MYQITGSQKTLTASGVDLVAMAKGAGLAQSEWARDEAHFEALAERALGAAGPWLIGARIDGAKPAAVTERDAAKIRSRFMEALAAKGD
jgi:hypothetical protein